MEAIILSIGFIGLISIFFTKQGFIGGAVSVIAFATYFFIYGTGQWLYFTFFFLGIALIILEMFIPSAGIVGIVGGALVFAGLVYNSASVATASFNLLIAFVLSVATVLTLLKMGYRFRVGKQMVLESSLDKQKGYRSSGKDYTVYLNRIGEAVTPLRPVGKAVFAGEELEVVAPHHLINRDESVEVYRVDGNTLYVRPVKDENNESEDTH